MGARLTSADEEAKVKAWADLSVRTADDLPMIGTFTSPGVMVYVHDGFKNVPEIGLAGWIAHAPGNACPEVFYIER